MAMDILKISCDLMVSQLSCEKMVTNIVNDIHKLDFSNELDDIKHSLS